MVGTVSIKHVGTVTCLALVGPELALCSMAWLLAMIIAVLSWSSNVAGGN